MVPQATGVPPTRAVLMYTVPPRQMPRWWASRRAAWVWLYLLLLAGVGLWVVPHMRMLWPSAGGISTNGAAVGGTNGGGNNGGLRYGPGGGVAVDRRLAPPRASPSPWPSEPPGGSGPCYRLDTARDRLVQVVDEDGGGGEGDGGGKPAHGGDGDSAPPVVHRPRSPLPPRYLRLPYRTVPGVGSRAIVVAHHKEDVSWLPTYFPDFTPFVYAANDTDAPHHLVHPQGREAGAFLSFILDYYDDLPDLMAFVHAHRESYHTWHNDIVNALARVRWDRVRGYVSLNALEHHSVGPGDWNFDFAVANWRDLFGTALGDPPERIQGYCCAQFVVRRDDILAHPRAFYEELYVAVFDEALMGVVDLPRVLEHTWHMIFGQPAITPEVPPCDVFYCDSGDPRSPDNRAVPPFEGRALLAPGPDAPADPRGVPPPPPPTVDTRVPPDARHHLNPPVGVNQQRPPVPVGVDHNSA